MDLGGPGPVAVNVPDDRTGPFWDGVAGRVPIPQAAATLGFELVVTATATAVVIR